VTNSLSDLPNAPEHVAKTLLANLVKNSFLLAGKVNVYSYAKEDGPFADAAPESLPRPYVRISVRPQPSYWACTGVHRFPLDLVFEIAVDGLYDQPLLNLWSAVRTALSDHTIAPGGKKTVWEVKQAAGITISEFELGSYGLTNQGQGINRFMMGVGFARMEILVNT
jgi:hypothetical protein